MPNDWEGRAPCGAAEALYSSLIEEEEWCVGQLKLPSPSTSSSAMLDGWEGRAVCRAVEALFSSLILPIRPNRVEKQIACVASLLLLENLYRCSKKSFAAQVSLSKKPSRHQASLFLGSLSAELPSPSASSSTMPNDWEGRAPCRVAEALYSSLIEEEEWCAGQLKHPSPSTSSSAMLDGWEGRAVCGAVEALFSSLIEEEERRAKRLKLPSSSISSSAMPDD